MHRALTRPVVAFWIGSLGLWFSASAQAAPPQINAISPLGVQRGTAADLTITGAGMAGNPRLVAPFRFTLQTPAPAGSDAGNFKSRVLVDPATPLGVYPVRVQTDEGLSNPFLLAVGQLPQVPEKEDNSFFEQAQTITVPAVVEGQSAGNDVDYFKFRGQKGQRIVVDAQCARIGSGVDPSIRLTTASHKFVASADDTPGLLTDARLFAELPADGEYVVELSDSRYQGGGRPVYRLIIGAVPAAEEVYPLGAREGETTGLELRGGNVGPLSTAATTPAAIPGTNLAAVRVSSGMIGHAATPALDVESLPRLVVDDVPQLREPALADAPPTRGAAPVVFNGRIDPEGDEDRFVVVAAPGQKLRVEVEAADVGSALDGTL